MAVSGTNALGEQTLLVFKGQANGTYNLTPTFSNTTNNLALLDVRQMSNDNHLDIIAGSGSIFLQGQPASAYIFRNNADGTFTEVFHSATYNEGLLQHLIGGTAVQPLLTPDVNNDTINDLILLAGSLFSSNLTMHIVVSGGAGFVEMQDITVPNFAASTSEVQVFDFDNDTHVDIFVPQSLAGAHRATIFYNQSSLEEYQGFTNPGLTVLPTITPAQFPHVADFNNDNELDVVFTGVSGATTAVETFLGTGGKSFAAGVVSLVTPRINLNPTTSPSAPDPLLDYTGDGRPDIIVYANNAAATNEALGLSIS